MAGPYVFTHAHGGVVCVVHGGEFALARPNGGLEATKGEMQEKYQLTVGASLGPGGSGDKEGLVVNRVAPRCGNTTGCEHDPGQVGEMVHEPGFEGARGVAPPGAKISSSQLGDTNGIEECKRGLFRATATAANYLPVGRVDVNYAAQEDGRSMRKPVDLI